MSWSRRFDEPIILPNGKKLLTLKDAIAWLAKEIPKSEHGMKRVQAAAHCVTEAATLRRADDVCADRHHAGIDPSPRSRVQSEAIGTDHTISSVSRRSFRLSLMK